MTPREVNVKLSKTYKSSLENEQKLKKYLNERYFKQILRLNCSKEKDKSDL
jgi:hypothetical protein